MAISIIGASTAVRFTKAVDALAKDAHVGRRVAFPMLASTLLLVGTPVFAQTTHSLDVTKHFSVTLGDGDVDNILIDGTNALKTDTDGPVGTQDTACDVTLSRSGQVGGFSNTTAPSKITSQGELDTVFAESSFVKVVQTIEYCDKAGFFAGCAYGSGTMIVAHPGQLRGLVWAHEYGHVAGLHHVAFSKALMTGANLKSDQTYVEQAECVKFEGGPKASPFGSPVPKSDGKSLIGLINSVIVDQFPYDEFAAQSPDQLPAVKALLQDVSEQASWANALIAIGIIGSVEDASYLSAFVAGNVSGGDPAYVYQAKSAALLGLGYLLHRTQSEQALTTLRQATSAESWLAFADDDWLGTSEDAREVSILGLQKTALLALGLSGTEAGAAILSELSGSASGLGIEPANFDSYLQLNGSVAKGGLSAYYAAQE